MADSGHDLVRAEVYGLGCDRCCATTQVPGTATMFQCASCGARNYVCRCARCDGTTVAVGTGGRNVGAWTCAWCLHWGTTASLHERGRPSATAADARASLEEHGLTGGDPHARLLGGFMLLATSDDSIPLGTACSIAGLEDGVLVVAAVDAKRRVLFPYADLLGLEVGGRGIVTTGRSYSGGGFGVRGALVGMAVASMLNTASQKSTIDSFIRITSRQAEMVLSHPRYGPEAIRNGFSMMFIRYQNAARAAAVPVAPAPPPPAPPSPIDELERLTRLHAAGTLTDNEFEMAKIKQIRRLHDGEG
jgi:hypothetical protein